jgi:hypothetical protein
MLDIIASADSTDDEVRHAALTLADAARTLLAERDPTPVDAEWLDGMLTIGNDDGKCTEWFGTAIEVTYWKRLGYFDLDSEHLGPPIKNPTRGDVLTALRLFRER